MVDEGRKPTSQSTAGRREERSRGSSNKVGAVPSSIAYYVAFRSESTQRRKMADIVLGSAERIFKLAKEIKKAVDAAKQNTKDCAKISERAADVSTHLKRLTEETTAMEDPAMENTLKRMEESLESALKLVEKCKGKNFFLRYWTAMGMSKELRGAQDHISHQLDTLKLATQVDTRILLEKQRPTPQQHQQYAGLVETWQSTDSGTDQARSAVVNSKKGKTVAVRREQSELLSGVARFNLSQLKDATNDFSNGSMVTGGYYKGVLSDGLDVAIKELPTSDDLEERRLQQVLNIRAKLRQGNIVKLLGYCLDAQKQKKLYFLVEEYIPNVQSLKRIIINKDVSRLDWPSCFKIIQGIAKGLHCLHKHGVLYMDLNPADILVRSDMNPLIMDFGSSTVLDGDDDEITGDNLTGTRGYVAPEKLIKNSASMKSDVFSFGIILIEIITGRIVSPLVDLPEWGSLDEMIRSMNGLFDPALADESQLMKINRCRDIGLKCIERDPKLRPAMADVLELLNS